MARRSCCLLTTIAVSALACRTDGNRESHTIRIDSAGIEIVTHAASAMDRPLTWAIDSEPLVLIGVAAGGGQEEFHRVDGVVALGTDQIAVLNGGTAEIRVFDLAGHHVMSRGRQGSGPGEFQFPRLLAAFGRDSLLIYDMVLRRFTILTAAGELRISDGWSPRHLGRPVGATADGHVITRQGSALAGPDSPEEVLSDTVRYAVLSRSGPSPSTTDTDRDDMVFAEFDGRKLLRWKVGDRFGFTTVPFDVEPTAVAGGHGIHVLLGNVPEIQQFAPDGTRVRIIRYDGATRPLRPSLFATHVDSIVAAAPPEARAELRRRYGLMQPPSVAPVFDRILVDERGDLWLRDAHARDWVVLDSAGATRGRVTLPTGLDVTQIADDVILGYARDEMGVERVRMHRVTRR